MKKPDSTPKGRNVRWATRIEQPDSIIENRLLDVEKCIIGIKLTKGDSIESNMKQQITNIEKEGTSVIEAYQEFDKAIFKLKKAQRNKNGEEAANDEKIQGR